MRAPTPLVCALVPGKVDQATPGTVTEHTASSKPEADSSPGRHPYAEFAVSVAMVAALWTGRELSRL